MTTARQIKTDHLVGDPGYIRAREDRRDTCCGGLGGDSSFAPVRGHAGPGNRPDAGRVPQHRETGARLGKAAEVPAPGEGVDRGRGRAADPLAAQDLSDDAGDGDHRADRLDRSVRVLSGRVVELRPAYLPPDPASRTAYEILMSSVR